MRERLLAELDAVDPEWWLYYHLHPHSDHARLKQAAEWELERKQRRTP